MNVISVVACVCALCVAVSALCICASDLLREYEQKHHLQLIKFSMLLSTLFVINFHALLHLHPLLLRQPLRVIQNHFGI